MINRAYIESDIHAKYQEQKNTKKFSFSKKLIKLHIYYHHRKKFTNYIISTVKKYFLLIHVQ